MKKIIFSLTAFLSVISITSCDKDFNTIGSEIVGGDHFDFEKYDVQNDRWTIAAELPRPRLGGSGGCIDGKMYVITGHVRTENGSQPVSDNIVLELA